MNTLNYKMDIDVENRDNWTIRSIVARNILRNNGGQYYNAYEDLYHWECRIEDLMTGLEGEGVDYLNACIETCKQKESIIIDIINDRIHFVESREKEKREKEEDEEAFKDRWTVYRRHFCGKYMRFVETVDDLKAQTWCEYGNRLIFVIEDADYDYGYYSKSYGHPKKTVNSRRVVIKKLSKRGYTKGCVVVEKEYEIDSFKQTNILKAIAEHFGIEMPKKDKMQTTPFYELKKVRKGMYKQVFGKQIVGYVATDDKKKLSCHGRTEKSAIEGLALKSQAFDKEIERTSKKIFTTEFLHNKFGFCAQGMREFAESAGIDMNGCYSISELRNAAKKAGKDIKEKYFSELRKIEAI